MPEPVKVSQFAAELPDREAIRDCLYRYSRGVDRCDDDMLRSVYWDDAVDDHVLFTGAREELIACVMPLLRGMEASQHTIANIFIRLHGNRADVESYYQGYHRVRDGNRSRDSIQSGRYVDRFEIRGDEWRIVRRKVVLDWFREYDDAGDWERGPHGHPGLKAGGRKPADYSYTDADLA